MRPCLLVLMTASSPWSQAVVTDLARRGFRVHVVDYSDASDGYMRANSALDEQLARRLDGLVECVHRPRTRRSLAGRVLEGAFRLRRLARRERADLVLSLYGGASAAIAWLSGTRPYVVYVVGSDILLADTVRRGLSRIALSRAALVLANGRYLGDRARDVAPRANVRPLYLGVDLQRLTPGHGSPGGLTFVCTRGFSAVYDNLTIVRAVAELGSAPEGFQLDFLSTGPLLAEAVTIADAILPSDLRERVRFANGVGEESLLAALRSSHFYISASRSDGASASLLEAMACGLLPILSDIPANREWVTDGQNGLLFPPGDHVALARCMQACVTRPPWMTEAVRANRRLVEERADSAKTMEELADLLMMTMHTERRSN